VPCAKSGFFIPCLRSLMPKGGVRIDAAGDAAVEDDVASGLVWRGAGLCGEVDGSVGVDLGVVEDGGGVAEDEVDAAFDVGVDIVLAAVVGEEGCPGGRGSGSV